MKTKVDILVEKFEENFRQKYLTTYRKDAMMVDIKNLVRDVMKTVESKND